MDQRPARRGQPGAASQAQAAVCRYPSCRACTACPSCPSCTARTAHAHLQQRKHVGLLLGCAVLVQLINGVVAEPLRAEQGRAGQGRAVAERDELDPSSSIVGCDCEPKISARQRGRAQFSALAQCECLARAPKGEQRPRPDQAPWPSWNPGPRALAGKRETGAGAAVPHPMQRAAQPQARHKHDNASQQLEKSFGFSPG